MQKENTILPGTPAWESICQMCGLCCLLKTVNEYGRVCLTRVRCRHLSQDTHLCDCYNMKFDARNDAKNDSCFKSGGSPVNLETLHHDYVVPGCCPYVKRFVSANKLERPVIDWQNTISETELSQNANLQDYIVPGTGNLFRYNACVKQYEHKR